MTKQTNQFSLDAFEQLPDGSYRKKKTVEQPRDVRNYQPEFKKAMEYPVTKKECFRKITLNLFGEPMPKQSVRSYCTKAIDKKSGRHILAHFQPKEMEARTKDYIRQIKEQLPKDFEMFQEQVHITKMHFVFAPLKGFSKKKMDQIREGEIIYKNTRPDVADNLKKLPLDALSGLVYKDDGLIVSEDNIKKYYGVGGMIILELSGW
jgi:Holliday junction resolvase RusA-like endonuclease